VLIGFRLNLRRSALAGVTLLTLAAAALVAASPAAAAKTDSCAKAVLEDWYDNGRVDNIYPQHCYREAIKLLPVDIRDYSSAREDILRALAYAKQGKPDPGDGGSNDGGSNNNGGGGTTGKGNNNGGGGTTGTGGNTGEGSTVQPGGVDTSGPSAIPVPLIVLAAIAALLLALGAAGYLTRRRRATGDAPPAT
jgi:uncharacterized membrane protein YgcG